MPFLENFEHVRLHKIRGDSRCKIHPYKGTKDLDSKIIPEVIEIYGVADGTQGYYVAPSAAKRLLRYAFPICLPIDGYKDLFYYKHHVKNLCFKDVTISSDELPSSIKNTPSVNKGTNKKQDLINPAKNKYLCNIVAEIYRIYLQARDFIAHL